MEPSHISPQTGLDTGQELTLSDVARVVLARRKMMLVIVVAVAAIALGWAWYSAMYRGEGVLQTPTVALSDFNRYSIPLRDGPAFLDFLATRKDFTPDEIAFVRSQLAIGDGASRWVRPAFGFTKSDIKDVPEFGFTKGNVKDLPESGRLDNQFVGAEIQVEARSRDVARKLAEALGEYVGNAILRGRILDFVGTNFNDTRIALGKLENEALQNQFLLMQEQKRLADMRDINRRYPEASRDNPRQVVSLEKGGTRYLSPVTQIVGAESYIVDINETLRKLARDRERLETDLAVFTLARDAVDKAPLGRQALLKLETALSEAYRKQDIKRDAVRESFNSVELGVGQLRYLSKDGLRFVSPPVVRDPSYGRIVAITVAAAVAGMLLAALVSLGLAWGASLKSPNRKT